MQKLTYTAKYSSSLLAEECDNTNSHEINFGYIFNRVVLYNFQEKPVRV